MSLFREHSGRTDDMDTTEHATFRYDTVEVEYGLEPTKCFQFLNYLSRSLDIHCFKARK